MGGGIIVCRGVAVRGDARLLCDRVGSVAPDRLPARTYPGTLGGPAGQDKGEVSLVGETLNTGTRLLGSPETALSGSAVLF